MRTRLHYAALLAGALTLALFTAEAALRVYASYMKQEPLFQSDAQLGWRNVPNLVTSRINAAGEEWSIRTDQDGQRLLTQTPHARSRMLILGDSLSFGEGIDIEDRFDVRMLPSLSDMRIINTGTIGYGTDQEYVAFLNWKHVLRPGDIILIVLNKSDYFDVLRRRFVGRATPYFEEVDGSLVLRPPPITLLERWSDWSLLARAAAKIVERDNDSESLESGKSMRIIRFILSQIRKEAPSGVRVVLAHLGTRDLLGPTFNLSSTTFCQFADVCVDLDDALADPAHLLPDEHWSASGHAAVADAVLKALHGDAAAPGLRGSHPK